MKVFATFLLLVCSMPVFGQSATMLDSKGQKSDRVLISSNGPVGALVSRDEMLSPGRWTPAASPPGMNLNATGKTYMAFTDIHNTYENAFKSGGCAGGSPFSGEVNWNLCTFPVQLVTYLDKPMADGTVTVTSTQVIALGFVMGDVPNLPFNSMFPATFTGRNAAGRTTLYQGADHSLVMDHMGMRSDLNRSENYVKREIAARVRDVLVAHEQDWHVTSEPMESYPGATRQAEGDRKMIQQALSPDTCNGCGIKQTPTHLQEVEQAAKTARVTVEQDKEKLVVSQARMEAVLAEGTVPPAVQERIRARLEVVQLGPQRVALAQAQANAAAAEQEYEKVQAEASRR